MCNPAVPYARVVAKTMLSKGNVKPIQFKGENAAMAKPRSASKPADPDLTDKFFYVLSSPDGQLKAAMESSVNACYYLLRHDTRPPLYEQTRPSVDAGSEA
jgi:hypothetical protein